MIVSYLFHEHIICIMYILVRAILQCSSQTPPPKKIKKKSAFVLLSGGPEMGQKLYFLEKRLIFRPIVSRKEPEIKVSKSNISQCECNIWFGFTRKQMKTWSSNHACTCQNQAGTGPMLAVLNQYSGAVSIG